MEIRNTWHSTDSTKATKTEWKQCWQRGRCKWSELAATPAWLRLQSSSKS